MRDLQKREGISYKNALVKASPLWKEQKAKKAKAPKRKKAPKKKVIEGHVEVNEFPPKTTKAKKKKKASRKVIPSTQAVPLTNLGGSIVPQDDRTSHKIKPKGRKRLRKKHTILYDIDSKFLARKARI